MKIGMIIHSKTGTTLKFGKLTARKLIDKGHSVEVTELKTDVPAAMGSAHRPAKFTITNIPDCTKYDVVLIGGPVWGFSASPVIMELLKGLKGVAGKRLLPFVTMGFTFPSMGGKQAVALMSSTASGKGAVVLPGSIVPKLFRNHGHMMEKAAAEIISRIS